MAMASRFVFILLGGLFSTANAQSIPGSLADQLGIGADAATAAAALSGTGGVGIPISSTALGILPGEPVLIVNNDVNAIAVVGGAIEERTGGVVPSGAAQNVIRAGISGGDVVDVIVSEGAGIVAQAVEEQSGGFIPASASRPVIQTAINGGDVGDALVNAAFDRIVQEAERLLVGQVGTAVQNATSGIVDVQTVTDLFNGAVQGQRFEPLFRNALRQRLQRLQQQNGNNNPIVIVN